jgi:hypothetical protein
MMQIGRRYTGCVCDGIDLRLGTPVSADVRNRTANDVVVRGRGRKRRELGEAVGQFGFGKVHVHDRYLGRPALTNHPISG